MTNPDKKVRKTSDGHIMIDRIRPPDFGLYLVILLIILADFSLFVSIRWDDCNVFTAALVFLLIALLFSSAMASFSRKIEVIQTGKFLSILSSFTLVSASIPSFGDAYIDILVPVVLFFIALLLSGVSFVDHLPRRSSVIALMLIIGIGSGFLSFIGLSAKIIQVIRVDLFLPLLPIAAFFGYMEEVFFRNGLQKSMEAISWRNQSIIFPALLNAGSSVLWGSIELCIIVFFVSLVMGILYRKYHSVILNGITRSLECGLVIGLAFLF